LKSIGHVMHTVGNRLLVVRCDPAHLPRMHTDVIDKRMKPVGRVVDVFGNVSAPCAAILCRAEARADAGEMLFIK